MRKEQGNGRSFEQRAMTVVQGLFGLLLAWVAYTTNESSKTIVRLETIVAQLVVQNTEQRGDIKKIQDQILATALAQQVAATAVATAATVAATAVSSAAALQAGRPIGVPEAPKK